MRCLIIAASIVAAVPLSAQQNPFKLPKVGVKGAEVTYTMTGDITGTATVAMDGERMARRATSVTKMMGKTTNSDTWSLTTPDSTWRADVAKKKGTVAPNMLPYMAKAYDDLDGDSKKRLHQNMQEMASVLSRAFSLSSINSGEKVGTKTYAGQECEEKKFGTVSVCTMTKAPIMLHTQGSMMCINYEETATDVKLGGASPAAFAPPEGVVFTADTHLQQPDSVAKGYVSYLSSQQLADSLAKAKAALAQAGAGGQTPTLTPEQQAQMQKACEAMKSLDVNKMMADAADQALKGLADAAKQAAVDAAKNAAADKVKGIFKKPKIPTR